MSSIFPLRETVSNDKQGGPRLVDLDEETADEVFEALAAQTTRQIFLSLHEQPQTASDLAEETDTSVQNVQYHLEKLQDVDLIDHVDTWYSERGSEMNVYAPTDESLVLFAGRDKRSSFRSLFDKIAGVASVLVPGSLLAGWVASRSGTESEDPTVDELATDGGESVDTQAVDVPEDGAELTRVDSGNEIGIASEDAESGSDVILDAADLNDTEVILTGQESDAPVLITDGGNATELSEGALSGLDAASGIDPALAAALGFFLGGLLVVAALWAWYGTPDSS
jgi:DNA-binding transcriptional ArsR family regulator